MKETSMSAVSHPTRAAHALSSPRFGGFLWRLVRRSTRIMLPLAGRRWNPIFAIVEHRGRRSGRIYRTPVAVRRVDGGFVLALAFGAQVDWYRNLVAGSGGVLRWRARDYPIGAPRAIDAETAISTFMLIQRVALRAGRIDGYIRVDDR